jgi:iron complex outermembrane recepter protein
MRQSLYTTAAAVALSLALSSHAFAQTAPTNEVDVVIVTAQKREENLQKVPAAVSVLSAATIANANAVNIEGITALVPSLSLQKGATTLNAAIFLRGVGTQNFSIAAEPSVSFVVDGVVMSKAGEAFGDLYDLQRMEVLRGPQGTLFGKNASAGVINIVTRKAGRVFQANLEATATDDSELKFKGAVDLPLGERAASRITAFVGNWDGNLTNRYSATNDGTGSRKVNGYDRWGVRTITDFKVNDALNLTLIADYRKATDNCCTSVVGWQPASPVQQDALKGVNFRGFKTRDINQDTTAQSLEEAWGASLQGDYELANGSTITSITAYRSFDVTEIRDGDFKSNPAGYVGGGSGTAFDVGPQSGTTFSQELRLTSPSGGKLEYVLGAFYFANDSKRTFQRNVTECTASTLAPNATGGTPCTAAASTFRSTFARAEFGAESTNFALFGQGNYDFTERLSLIAGLRYTRDELSYFHNRTNLATFASGYGLGAANALVPSGFVGSTSEDNVSGKIGLQYAANENVDVYATYTQGYKGPAYDVFFNMRQALRNVVEAETADSYEAGFKAQVFNGKLIFNLASFYAVYDNFQANSPDIDTTVTPNAITARLTNAGEVSTRGVEVDFLARPTRNLRLSGGFAFTDAQIEEFKDPATGLRASVRRGEPLPYAPKTKGSLAIDYRQDLASLPFDVAYSLQYSYTDQQRSSIPANVTTGIDTRTFQPSYTNVDASVSFSSKDGRLSVVVFGKNLTDSARTPYIETNGPLGALATPLNGLALGSSPLFRVGRDADAYYGITLKAKFGG